MALCPNVKVLAKDDLSVFVLTSRAGVRAAVAGVSNQRGPVSVQTVIPLKA
jgi:hypothetical protein